MIADKKREKKENRRTKETKKGSQNMIKACIFDLDGTILNGVAEDYTISDDGTVYTFTLKDGVKFHDGSDLTAQDVAFSYERFTTIGQGYAYLFQSHVDKVEATDDSTVTITGGKVTNVAIDASGETPDLGGKAAEALSASLLAAGSTAGVDAVSGSTMTSDAVFAAMNDCLAQAAQG